MPATGRSAACPVPARRGRTRRSAQAAGPAPTSWSAGSTQTRKSQKETNDRPHLCPRAPGVRPRARRRVHALVHGALGFREVDDRPPRRPGARRARPRRRVPRRRHGAHAPLEGPRVLQGGPRHEHRANWLGRFAHHAPRRHRHHRRHLALRRDAPEGAGPGRAVRAVRRGLRERVGRGVRVSAVITTGLIAPHGGELAPRAGERPADLDSLEAVTLTSRELSDLDMLASGALSPLRGFMGKEDYEGVVESMRLADRLPYALPVCLAVEQAPSGDRVALADESGRALAVLEVEEVYAYDKEREAERCFRTTDGEHPGVARLYAQHGQYLAGAVTVFERLEPGFPELHRDPADSRALFAERGWKRVVGFQTRNPIHRAHEYLTKCALETVDGLLVHPLVGETKSDDIPAAVRMRCYEILIDKYYPADRVILSVYPAAMR